MDRRHTQRGEERRRQLLDFAATRFAENGFHPTSVAEIVEGIGVGKGVFYWYFDSKEALLQAILSEGQHDLRLHQQAAIAGAETPSERIERGLRASIRWSLDQPVLFRLFQMATADGRFSDTLRKSEAVAVSDAARHVADAMAAGEIPDGNPELLAHAMFGVHTRMVHLVHRGVLKADDETIDTTVSFCLHGISAV